MIRRIAIDGYKSLQGVEVSLEPLNVVIGPNGAGNKARLREAARSGGGPAPLGGVE